MLRVKILNVAEQAASVNTEACDISLCETVSVQIVAANVSEDVSFSAQVEVSNDKVNWDAVSGAAATISAAGSNTIAVSPTPYKYARVALTRTAGSADFVIRLFGTEVAEV